MILGPERAGSERQYRDQGASGNCKEEAGSLHLYPSGLFQKVLGHGFRKGIHLRHQFD